MNKQQIEHIKKEIKILRDIALEEENMNIFSDILDAIKALKKSIIYTEGTKL